MYCYIICISCPHNVISIQDSKCLIFSNNSLLKPELQIESSLQLYPLSCHQGFVGCTGTEHCVTVWSFASAITYIPHLRSSSLETCSFERFIWLHNFHYKAPSLKTTVFYTFYTICYGFCTSQFDFMLFSSSLLPIFYVVAMLLCFYQIYPDTDLI